ncbi:MAG: 50S ribosomal protein L18 [Gemmatimonadota bacterium]|jgi:large subunit ribosomal protein L18
MTHIRKYRKSRRVARERRHRRIRKKIWGTAERPRLVVYRSLKNLEGQLVDDDAGQTLTGISTLDPSLRDLDPEGNNRKKEQAFAAGKLLAERAREQGVESIVFDRGGYQYHGRVQAFAEGAREGGLKF